MHSIWYCLWLPTQELSGYDNTTESVGQHRNCQGKYLFYEKSWTEVYLLKYYFTACGNEEHSTNHYFIKYVISKYFFLYKMVNQYTQSKVSLFSRSSYLHCEHQFSLQETPEYKIQPIVYSVIETSEKHNLQTKDRRL